MSSNNAFIALNLKDSVSPNTTYYFKWCNRKLFYKEQDKPTGKYVWLCIFYNIEVMPDNQLLSCRQLGQDLQTTEHCCFWYSIGLPQKEGCDMPLLHYQKTAIQSTPGLGLSTSLLRYIVWYSVSNISNIPNSRVCIITGPSNP
jgi:hypothetical protein